LINYKNDIKYFNYSVKTYLLKFSNFWGRSSRLEFLNALLFYFSLLILISLIEMIFSIEPKVYSALFQLFFSIPTFAIIIRRLHDVNLSGFWYLIVFTIIGIIPLIYYLFSEGDVGENDFGLDPLNKKFE